VNGKRGLWAVAIFIVVWIIVFFIAFMTAFGTDYPMAGTILKGVEVFAVIANPLWGIPIAFLIGVYSKRKYYRLPFIITSTEFRNYPFLFTDCSGSVSGRNQLPRG